jgi:hypothetical protein
MDPVRIVLDAFPVEVRTSDRVWRDARVALLEGGELAVWTSISGEPNPGPGPFRVLTASALSREGTPSRGMTLQTDSHGTVTLKMQSGCGCGNPLRSWNPWPGRVRQVVGLG